MISNLSCFQQLCEVIPGGVNSPFRAFTAVGGTPPVLQKGQGARVWDVEGRSYLDFCCAWGPLMLGHAHPALILAARAALEDGCVYGASTPWEGEFARLIRDAYPSMEQVRLVNSGAEAVGSALRVARGATRRPRILKFEGCYHGHVECLDGSGLEAEELGGALALGASPGSAAETLIADFNSLASAQQQLECHPGEVAAVIVEPIPGSMSVVRPDPEFLPGLRELCDRHGALLIFDEVLSGSRVARGGAQELFGVRPDLTCLGKALAGGMPVGAYGGARIWMKHVAPLGSVYQAGTFCGNPVTVRSGLANLQLLAEPDFYPRQQRLTARLQAGVEALGSGLRCVAYPSMFALYYAPQEIRNHHDLPRVDLARFARLFARLLQDGMYLPPSCLDAAGLSSAHTEDDVDALLAALQQAEAHPQG